MTDAREDLEELAQLYDVDVEFQDADGEWRVASPDTLRAVLAALGAAVTDPGDAVRAERLRRHRRVVDPVVALRSAAGPSVPLSIPRSAHPRDCWLTVTAEDGSVHRSRLMPAIHRPLGSASFERVSVDRYEARISPAAQGLPPGYYLLRVEGPSIDASSLVVVAPRCPVPARGWGVFLPVQSMRTRDDWGVGNYPSLGRLTRWVEGLGGQLVGSLPLYPALLDGPVEVSPYLPATRLGWNELYVDPTAVPELEAAPEAQALLASPAFCDELARARRSAMVDYPTSMSLVRRALAPMAQAMFSADSAGSARRRALERFLSERPELLSYARFRGGLDFQTAADVTARGGGASCGEGDGGVPDDAGGNALAGGTAGAKTSLADRLGNDEARYHAYAQFVADEQLGAVGRSLLLDLPAGTHPDGFDPRFEPGIFVEGVQGGAPPDRFFRRGQRWGFRPLHPQALRQQRYRHVVALLRHAMTKADVMRLDHVMGLYRLYWVPDGAQPTDGAYVRYPADELRAVAVLEAHRSSTAIVGEDLGTVPDEVREGMAQDRMLRSWVLEFEVTPDAPAPEPPELSVASISTHDLDRFVTFFERPEQSSWRRVMGGDARRALRASLDHMARSAARLVMTDLEDLWLERWPHNRPGTGPEAGNWQHRSARTLEDVQSDSEVAGALRRIDELRREDGE